MTTAPPRSATLIVNPTAGGGRVAAVVRQVEARLNERQAPFRTVATRDAEHARTATREALERGELPVAIGGDGMLGLVAGAAADVPEATIGVIPAGRGNDFVRGLELPTDPVAATDVLLDGTPISIDTGLATDAAGARCGFLSIASCGFDSEANRIANEAPSRLGGAAYLWGVFGALVGLRPATFQLRLDGEQIAHHGVTVAIANAGTYGGGMRMAPDASVVDGRFDVVLIGHGGRDPERCDWRDRLRLVRFLPQIFRGAHVSSELVEVRRASEVLLDADRPFAVYADGDPIGALPLTLTTRPASLRLLVPVGHHSTPLRMPAEVTA